MNKISFLPELIDKSKYKSFNDFIDDLFYIVYTQFFVDKIRFSNQIVKINQTPLKCTQNDNCGSLEYTCNNCPFIGKYERFNHIVTGLNENTRAPGRYKENRAIRVHWIKYIIENVNQKEILYFEKNSKHYFWAKKENYIVIVKETKSGQYYLVTAFYVDDMTYYKRYERDYLNYMNNVKGSP